MIHSYVPKSYSRMFLRDTFESCRNIFSHCVAKLMRFKKKEVLVKDNLLHNHMMIPIKFDGFDRWPTKVGPRNLLCHRDKQFEVGFGILDPGIHQAYAIRNGKKPPLQKPNLIVMAGSFIS